MRCRFKQVKLDATTILGEVIGMEQNGFSSLAILLILTASLLVATGWLGWKQYLRLQGSRRSDAEVFAGAVLAALAAVVSASIAGAWSFTTKLLEINAKSIEVAGKARAASQEISDDWKRLEIYRRLRRLNSLLRQYSDDYQKIDQDERCLAWQQRGIGEDISNLRFHLFFKYPLPRNMSEVAIIDDVVGVTWTIDPCTPRWQYLKYYDIFDKDPDLIRRSLYLLQCFEETLRKDDKEPNFDCADWR